MAASYPTSAKTFTTKLNTDTIQASHVNDLQDEVAAVEAELLAGWTSYTPTWGGATGNPAIGDGTLSGRYRKDGKIVFFEINILIGSTTTMGTGSWTLTLPTTSALGSSYGSFAVRILDAGTAFHVGGGALTTTTTFAIWVHGASTAASATVPMTWAAGDTLVVDGFYVEA